MSLKKHAQELQVRMSETVARREAAPTKTEKLLLQMELMGMESAWAVIAHAGIGPRGEAGTTTPFNPAEAVRKKMEAAVKCAQEAFPAFPL